MLAAAIFAVVALVVVLVAWRSQWLREDVCRTEHLGVIIGDKGREGPRDQAYVCGVVDNKGRDGGLSDQMVDMRGIVIVSMTG